MKRFLNKNISDELDESDFLLNKISEKERENSSYGIEKINIEINQKSNNSNVEINPKNLLKEANKEKRFKEIDAAIKRIIVIKKKNSDLSNNNNIIIRKSKKLNIKNKKLNESKHFFSLLKKI